MYGIVYKITNLLDGKVYIGQTIQPLEKRWQNHCYYANRTDGCPKLARAIKKYGIDGFSVEEIAKANSKEELDRLESYFIEFYEGITKGYNLSTGGANKRPSEETRQKLSEAQRKRGPRGPHRPTTIEKIRQTKLSQHRRLSDEAKAHLSEVSKTQDKSHLRTQEVRDKISQTLLSKPRKMLPKARPCLVNGMLYMSPSEAAAFESIDIRRLWAVLKGYRKSREFSAEYFLADERTKPSTDKGEQ